MQIEYNGRDLEAMSFAVNYHRWILDEFCPFLGRCIVEVGAGTGGFSELLLPLRKEQLILIEPSRMVDRLRARLPVNEKVRIIKSTFSSCSRDLCREAPDSIIYVNVLEHIEDDVAELDLVYRTLVTGGRIFIFVPAHKWLFSSFDTSVGHFRRYSSSEIEIKCKKAGFKIVRSINFDMLGVVPWWIKYRLLKSNGLSPAAVAFYDRFALPVTRFIERIFGAIVGKNILLIGEKN